MRLDAIKLSKQIRAILDNRGLSGDELAAMASIDKTTVYRILNLKNKTVDRGTLRRLADGLDCDFIINGSEVKLLERSNFGGKKAPNDGNENGLRGKEDAEGKIGRIVKMLMEMDAETIETATSFVSLLAELQGNDLTILAEVRELLRKTENKEEWLKRLRALVTLIGPLADKDIKKPDIIT